MSCCRSVPCEQMFKPRVAERSLARYRRHGLDALERRMVERIVGTGVRGATVLEIGGGIGAVQVDLLLSGAATGEVVELVPAFEHYARQLAFEKGVEDRTSFVVVDVLEHPESVEKADFVILNRVVCCSPDGVELTAAAARLARRGLALVYPRDAAWTRAAVHGMNAWFWLLRRSFRTFLHRPSSLLAAAQAEGLVLAERDRDGVWEYAAFQRG